MTFEQVSGSFDSVAQNELLAESYAAMAQALLRFEDEGWTRLEGYTSEAGFSLQNLQSAAEHIRQVSEANPLLKRGAGLRTSYIFGRGVSFTEQPARVVRAIQDMQNQDVLFSAEAQVINERSHFTDRKSVV